MTTLGIILCWESTKNKKELKKDIIKEYLKDYQNLEEFLKKNLLDNVKEVRGWTLDS